ncbi:MAG: hypothetical protein J6N49_04280 [Alphaproteobacteria bacterium]|nr:hypothetical protein [Alphaproteobacteria bacterium]
MTFRKFYRTYRERADQKIVQLAYGYTLRGHDIDTAFQLAKETVAGDTMHRAQIFANGKTYEVGALTEKGLQYIKSLVERRGGFDVSDGFDQYHLERITWQHQECLYVVCQ